MKIAVAIALGLGTMIGWKRIVVTVGEKIGKTHLTYAQGACAEITAAATIAAADGFGLPVSTTHVLSSGIAGTMAANGSGLQWSTIRNIALAWVLTLPAAMIISGTLYLGVLALVLSRRKNAHRPASAGEPGVDDRAEREGGRHRGRRHQVPTVEVPLRTDGFDRGQNAIDRHAVAAERQQQSLDMDDASGPIAQIRDGVDRLARRHRFDERSRAQRRDRPAGEPRREIGLARWSDSSPRNIP